MYKYSFDKTTVGNFRLRRDKHKLLQECYQLMLKELEFWNRKALEQGAARPPFKQEADDLTTMIEWGNERLVANKSNSRAIVVNGISIGSLRYVKAALIYGIKRKEQELLEKSRAGWPSSVIQSIDEAIDRLREIEQSIEYPPLDLLWEILPQAQDQITQSNNAEWDVFICHAYEDKNEFARPLANALKEHGLKVWFDEFTLKVGDSLRRSIDRGLSNSRYGIVIISPNFLKKEWPQKELDGLATLEVSGAKVILPIWHDLDFQEVKQYSPMLADRVAVSSQIGINKVVEALLDAINVQEN